jgi:2-dehydro-3-deoxyphosphogluconate aldolase/(4S)-4-hydroxy-2-oxoglutarate aldolase
MLAVLRGTSPDRVGDAATVLADVGIDVLEITFTVPDCANVIASVKSARPAAMVGAGTVTTVSQLDAAVAAGADFIVTPGATPELLDALAGCGRPFLPGVLTPSEVMVALSAGAAGVKLFPGSFEGPSGLAALRGPFPELIAVPTGGVSPENLAQWRAAGAYAVGAGSGLAPVASVDGADHDDLRRRARTWLDALAALSD